MTDGWQFWLGAVLLGLTFLLMLAITRWHDRSNLMGKQKELEGQLPLFEDEALNDSQVLREEQG